MPFILPAAGGGTPGPGTVDTAALADNAVTYPKIQNVTVTDRVLGRSTAGAGDPEEIPFTTYARQMADDTSFGAMRTTLGATAIVEYLYLGSAPVEGVSFLDGITLIGGSGVALDPAAFTKGGGLTAAFALVGAGFTDNASRTATLTLWDVTTDLAVATATFNNAATSAAFTPVAVTLNATPHVYELRLSCSGSTTDHRAFVNNASLRITWS